MLFYSAKINEIHLKEKFGMVLRSMHCVQPPSPRQYMIDLPGADGKVDLSEAQTGYPLYDNRKITMEFGTGYSQGQWPAIYSEIMKNFHNREVKVIFDDDRGYYYRGRASVTGYERARTLGIITIDIDADPYKYELQSSTDEWLWDTFSFVDGVIRAYKDIKVNGQEEVIVIGSNMPVIPTIITSADMKVQINGKSYDLKSGRNKMYDVVIMEGEYRFCFIGTGTISIEYRGGML